MCRRRAAERAARPRARSQSAGSGGPSRARRDAACRSRTPGPSGPGPTGTRRGGAPTTAVPTSETGPQACASLRVARARPRWARASRGRHSSARSRSGTKFNTSNDSVLSKLAFDAPSACTSPTANCSRSELRRFCAYRTYASDESTAVTRADGWASAMADASAPVPEPASSTLSVSVTDANATNNGASRRLHRPMNR